MKYTVSNEEVKSVKTDCLMVGIHSDKFSTILKSVDKLCRGRITVLKKQGDIDGTLGSHVCLHDVEGLKAKRLLLVGCGETDRLTEVSYLEVLDVAHEALAKTGAVSAVSTLTDLSVENHRLPWKVRQAVMHHVNSLYEFSQCQSEKRKRQSALKKISFHVREKTITSDVKRALQEGQAIGEGMSLARDLGNLPANICTPIYLGKQAKMLGKRHASITTTVLGEPQMKKLGMNVLLSVSEGSAQPARFIVMKYIGSRQRKENPIVLVGKGITFDSGGISIKPRLGLDEMKFDMCGAASVLGTMQVAAQLKLPLNIIGVVAASENLISGKATKPGDIITSMSGKTVEILNTDAEGRLVLCDTLTYCERFKPDVVVDVATLTNAMIIALGHETTGVMGNNSELIADLIAAGEAACDRAWQLPLWDVYESSLKSNFADLANIGGPGAASITAGRFLSNFATKFRWAHMDIAGTAWNSGAKKGATGRPVPLLVHYLLHRAKQKRG